MMASPRSGIAPVIMALLVMLLEGCAAMQKPEPPTVQAPASPAPASPPPVAALPATPPPVAMAPPPPAPQAAPRTDETVQAVSLLTALRLFAAMKPEEQRVELNEATQGFNRDRSNYARLKLALLLSMPETGLEDESRAVTLLEPVLKGAAGPLRDMASFVAVQLTARAGEKRKATQFKEQLDQLRAVDRSLLERGQPRGR